MNANGARNAIVIVVALIACVIGIAVPISRTPAPVRVPVAATRSSQTGRIAPVRSYRTLAPTLAPCEYEDSTGCVWDAGTSGNGVGNSFVALDENGTTTLYYESGKIVSFPSN
jgi:murein DD-endopeptidase MepM/ murein hydrolase activator NlpD